jgi:hypothetical protein
MEIKYFKVYSSVIAIKTYCGKVLIDWIGGIIQELPQDIDQYSWMKIQRKLELKIDNGTYLLTDLNGYG